ncbi:histidine phosphatase family protein [Aquibacillus salsiterrae]|uniref:Histidine phosphatase family protein n=1 Tax=Aquibacillus salsiterrae TaxID=2950439 RepID=A0A9X3WBQ6_9BACI|nr:histidine phosphatase family protein [Aquibacillus salsiterrae]MDC3415311.1 histidine phosphatase family protein [Aquibacillus salsiterrae]
MKRLLLIRHCNAEGQHSDSPLTREGIKQARVLADFLEQVNYPVDRIISSPYLRAIESIKPYADNHHVSVETDERLKERLLSEEPIDDWLDVLQQSFQDPDFRLRGGESSNDALARSFSIVQDTLESNQHDNVVLVTHGNLLAILLNEFEKSYGFDEWKQFSNPDVFMVEITPDGYLVQRLWEEKSANS